jgi:hypothetical protein
VTTHKNPTFLAASTSLKIGVYDTETSLRQDLFPANLGGTGHSSKGRFLLQIED